MLNRLKNAKPRYKILIGLWLAFEIISLPAAASVAFSITGKSAPLVVEPVEITETGMAQFLVTHSVPFDIIVSGTKSEVTVMIEDTVWEDTISSSCVRLMSTEARVAKTIDAPQDLDDPITSLYVTVSHDGPQTPDIRFEQVSFAPPAVPCDTL